MDWDDLVALYLMALTSGGRSAGTVRLHRHYLAMLARDLSSPLGCTRRDLETWLARPHWKPETRKSARTVVVGFFRWAASSEYVAQSPAANLMTVRVPQALPRPAPDAVLAAALTGARREVRLMLLLARYAGLRCTEIAGVHSANLDDDLLYIVGKGGKTRIVPLEHPELIAAIRRADGYLFPGRIDGHVSRQHVSILLSRQLPAGWTAHQLRHAFATRAYQNNPDVLALGRVLGHSKPETTMRYAQVKVEELRRVVAAAAA